ncbi:MAG: hypothetical protein P8N93_06335 [Flavobacteriaceae bacterium]|jgi:hypothetical protein|nr:hypothetical protein [Flavobacteriaceae bacterium]
MFFWHSSWFSFRKIFLTSFLLLSLYVVGQESPAITSPIFSSPNKPILGVLDNQKSADDFSFLNNKNDERGSLFEREQYIDTSAPYLKRLRKREEDNANMGYLGDTYLGDVNTSSKTAIIVCRDFEYEDGDRVQITLNDTVLLQDLYLKNKYFMMEIELKPGFNKFDFKALNQGASGPNTAELKVYDDQQKLLSSNQWNLSTGATATFIVVKQM